jgi:putative CocE/NonD family hydrolase
VNRWRDEKEWPLTRAVATPWHLHGDGGFGPQAPGADGESRSYVYDPQDPCPTTGGRLLLPGTYRPGPIDQAPIMGRRDVLVYTSEPLPEDLEVIGPVTAVLHAATSGPDTDWVVKLCDVYPDGRTYNIVEGVLRARYRDSATEPTLVEPWAVERYEIDLGPTAIAFRAGHRLRVLVTSSDFPRYDRNLNTGKLGIDSAEMRPALQTIFSDGQRGSHIVLPVTAGGARSEGGESVEAEAAAGSTTV